MTKTVKSYEVYEKFEPWMIGQKVEIGVYENGPDPEDNLADAVYTGRTAGVLQEYAEGAKDAGGKIMWEFVGSKSSEHVQDPNYHILISVVEPFER